MSKKSGNWESLRSVTAKSSTKVRPELNVTVPPHMAVSVCWLAGSRSPSGPSIPDCPRVRTAERNSADPPALLNVSFWVANARVPDGSAGSPDLRMFCANTNTTMLSAGTAKSGTLRVAFAAPVG